MRARGRHGQEAERDIWQEQQHRAMRGRRRLQRRTKAGAAACTWHFVTSRPMGGVTVQVFVPRPGATLYLPLEVHLRDRQSATAPTNVFNVPLTLPAAGEYMQPDCCPDSRPGRCSAEPSADLLLQLLLHASRLFSRGTRRQRQPPSFSRRFSRNLTEVRILQDTRLTFDLLLRCLFRTHLSRYAQAAERR